MQVKIEDKSTVKKGLSFEIPKSQVAKELDSAYMELKKSADIKGFRKGKIPRKVLENRFSKDVHADIAARLIQDSFLKAIETHDLKVVGSPQMDPPELKPDEDFHFDITIEIKPTLDDIEFSGIDLKKTRYEVSDAEIDSQIYMIQKTMAKKEPVKEERPAREKDFGLIDYEGLFEGKPYDKTPKIENYVMAIGNNNNMMPKEFSEKLIGTIPPQDLEIDVAYADDYFDENLAGKNIVYQVKFKELQEEVLPEVNDDLVKDLGQFKTLEDVKNSIRDNLGKGYARRVQHEMSEQVFTHLLEKYSFEVPDVMIEAELEGIIAEAEQAYAQSNMTLESVGLSRDTLKTEYREVAEKQAKRHLLLDKIISQENLELTEEELEKSFEQMARGMNASVDAVKNFFKMDTNQLEFYKHTQLEKKAVSLIIEKGNITEVEPDALEDAAEAVHEEQPEENKDA